MVRHLAAIIFLTLAAFASGCGDGPPVPLVTAPPTPPPAPPVPTEIVKPVKPLPPAPAKFKLPDDEPGTPKADSERTIVIRDDFDSDEGPRGLWAELRGHKKMKIERTEEGHLEVGGKFTELGSWDPLGLRTRPLDLPQFEAALRFKIPAMIGSGTKVVFLEIRWVDDSIEDLDKRNRSLMVYYQSRYENQTGIYAVLNSGSNEARKTDVDFGDEATAWHTFRIVHTGKQTRCYIDRKRLVTIPNDEFKSEDVPLKIKNPVFLIGVKSPADKDSIRVHFDDFVIYGDVPQ